MSGGFDGVFLWHTNQASGEDITLSNRDSRYVRYLYNPDRIVCICGVPLYGLDIVVLSLQGIILHTTSLAGSFYIFQLINNTHLICGNRFIQIHELSTGATSTFYNHSAGLFSSLAVHAERSVVIAGNDDGNVYVLDAMCIK